jgi:hypothetical protein
MISGRQFADARTDAHDNACAFMAKHDGLGRRPRPRRLVVSVAHARRHNTHQNFAWTRPRQIK